MPSLNLRSLIFGDPRAKLVSIGGRDYTPDEVQVLTKYNAAAAHVVRAIAEARSRLVELRQLDLPRVRLTIEQWRQAVEMAESKMMPSRYDWAQSIKEIETDGWLTAAVRLHTEAIVGLEWALVDRKSRKVDEEATERLEAPWVYDAVRGLIRAYFTGHSLIELGPYNRLTQELEYAFLFPTEHVNPTTGLILPDAMNTQAGTNYRMDKKLQKVLVETFGDTVTGIYGRAGQYVVYKKMALQYWSKFGELAAVPLRWAKTKGDKEHQQDLFDKLMNAKFANVLVTDLVDDEINFAPTNVTQPKQVFGELGLFCNSEISVLTIGSDMLMGQVSEGGYSQTTLQDLQSQMVIKSHAHKIAMLLNRVVLPKAQAMGWPVDMNRLRFTWNNKSRMNPKDQSVIDFGLADRGWEFPEEYVRETYNVEGKWGVKPNTGTPAKPEDSGTGGGGDKPVTPGTEKAQDDQKRQAQLKEPTARAEPPPFDKGCC